MKKHSLKSIIVTLIAIISIIALAVPSVYAADDDFLYITDVVQISDTQMLIYFNKPVAINLYGENRGPWVCIRIVNESNQYQTDTGDAAGNVLQYPGSLSFINDKHDVMLFEYGASAINISTIVNWEGDFAKYRKEGRSVRFCIEEVPFNENLPAQDGFIENVTTIDGKTYLHSNMPAGWDGFYMDIRKDFDLEVDLSKLEDVKSFDNIDYGEIMSHVKKADADTPKEPETIINKVVKNDPLYTAIWLGGSAVVAAGLAFGIGTLIRKGKAK